MAVYRRSGVGASGRRSGCADDANTYADSGSNCNANTDPKSKSETIPFAHCESSEVLPLGNATSERVRVSKWISGEFGEV